MPMREECKHFQSRTYDTGEVARFCVLGLAPNAPWSCPDDCASYERRLADAGWVHGKLVEPALEDEPEAPSPEMLAMLEEAEEVVEDAAPSLRSEVEQVRAREERAGRRWPWRRRG